MKERGSSGVAVGFANRLVKNDTANANPFPSTAGATRQRPGSFPFSIASRPLPRAQANSGAGEVGRTNSPLYPPLANTRLRGNLAPSAPPVKHIILCDHATRF
ncbi:hypothetical protein Rcae01_01212 [Novipirellula caenicola]|uniref:Uncharacterized protein n=1 Tax=Novipirellula caenicola TaxID=1536901 RepID=A0ABP9VMF4_9BACT